MKKFRILLATLVIAMSQPLFAQSDDFGMWGELNLEKKLSNKWSLDAGVEYRLRDNLKTSDRLSVGVDLNYKLTDWLKASAGYSLLDDHRYKENDSGKKYADYWGLRYRFNVSLTASHSFGDLSVSLRERWQYTYRPEKTVQRYYTSNGSEADEHTYGGTGKNVWRNRLQLKYKVSPVWRPYVNAETYISNGLDKIRYAAGTEIRLTKQHSFDLKYLFQHSYNNDDNEKNRHIIGIGYTYKF
jgi:hypothetical protein